MKVDTTFISVAVVTRTLLIGFVECSALLESCFKPITLRVHQVTKLFQFIYHCHRLGDYNDVNKFIHESKDVSFHPRLKRSALRSPDGKSQVIAFLTEFGDKDSHLNSVLYGVTAILAIICLVDILLGFVFILGTVTRSLKAVKYATLAATVSLSVLIVLINIIELANLFSMFRAVIVPPSIPATSLAVYAGTLIISGVYYKLEETKN